MKQKLVLYRLITFILLPIAGLLGLEVLFMLPVGLSNPIILIFAFIFFAIGAYIVSSFIFFLQGIQNNKQLKRGLKDFVRVNAIITVAVAAYCLFSGCVYLGSHTMQKMMADNFPTLQKSMNGIFSGIDVERYLRLMKKAAIVMAVFGALLVYHTIVTFRLLKQYASLFLVSDNKPQ